MLKEEHLSRLSGEGWDVLACDGLDAFEGPAIGIEVPEVSSHSDGAATPGFPLGVGGTENGGALCAS